MSAAVTSKVVVALRYDQRSDAAAAAVLARLLGVATDNREGAIADTDPEFLHQLRISVRRSRTVQRQLAAVFPRVELPGFRAEFRWLQQATGDARDLDVYLLGFDDLVAMVPAPGGADLAPLRKVLEHRRQTAHARMAEAVGSRRTNELLADWRALLDSLVLLPTADRPRATIPIGQLAGRRIRKVYKGIVKMGRLVEVDSPPEAYHQLRKKGKELRYMLELFGTQLFDDEVVGGMVRTLKALQDVLGRHQDREVQIAMLRSVADEVGGLPGGSRALLAMGTLVDRLLEDESVAREEFASRFAALASGEQRRLVKRTFV